jgi:hypothetical protein
MAELSELYQQAETAAQVAVAVVDYTATQVLAAQVYQVKALAAVLEITHHAMAVVAVVQVRLVAMAQPILAQAVSAQVLTVVGAQQLQQVN